MRPYSRDSLLKTRPLFTQAGRLGRKKIYKEYQKMRETERDRERQRETEIVIACEIDDK